MTRYDEKTVLEVDRLSVRFRRHTTLITAVTDASFTLAAGQFLALVGESGCGKSVLATAMLGLLPANAETRGSATLRGSGTPVDLLDAPERTLARTVRGRRVALVPQSAHSALTPTRTAGGQLTEALRTLGSPPSKANELADRVGLAHDALNLYPHELSGGMAQRVVLALALAGEPDLVLADEPTTGLDDALVERTVDELRALADSGVAVLMITHDIRAAERVATDLAVMYASRLVEVGPAADVLTDPWHTYTVDLLNALPERAFTPIPGDPPDLTALPPGCAYAVRSADHRAVCTGDPALSVAGDRRIACGMVPPDADSPVGAERVRSLRC